MWSYIATCCNVLRLYRLGLVLDSLNFLHHELQSFADFILIELVQIRLVLVLMVSTLSDNYTLFFLLIG